MLKTINLRANKTIFVEKYLKKLHSVQVID